MTILILGLVGLLALLGTAALAARWLARWLAARAADRFATQEWDSGLAIPMRDSDTRPTRRDSSYAPQGGVKGVEKSTTLV